MLFRSIKEIEKHMSEIGRRWVNREIALRYYTTMGEEDGENNGIQRKMERIEDAEIKRGITLIGPHRDEILFLLGKRNVRKECSQGEQKLITIMWRLAQGRLSQISGDEPVMLMDDCLSELDTENRASVMKELKKWGQVLITTTEDYGEFGDVIKINLDRG